MTTVYPTGTPLSEDVLIEIYLKLPFKKLKSMCELNEQIGRICDTDRFWKLYLDRNYFFNDLKKMYAYSDDSLTQIDEFDIPIVENAMIRMLSSYQLVHTFSYVIEEFSKENSYVSWQVFPLLSRVLTYEQLRVAMPVYANTLADPIVFTDTLRPLPMVINQYKIRKPFPKIYWFNVPSYSIGLNQFKGEGPGEYNVKHPNIICGLSRSGMYDYVASVDFVSQPCFYITPQGPISLNYDHNLWAIFYDVANAENPSLDNSFTEFLAYNLESVRNISLAKLIKTLSTSSS